MARQPQQPSPQSPPPVSRGHNRWPLALLTLVVLMVFSQVCLHEFLEYDDNHNIYQNELVTKATPATLSHFWKKPFAGMYIPLTYNFWALQAKVASFLPAGQLTELNPYLFHATNLLLHLANACLVFFILRRLVNSEWAAVLGALVFAVHPVQVEPVAWVTGGKDLLSAFFSLLALGRYIDYAQAPAKGKSGKVAYLLGCACLLAALLAKPSAVVLPLMAGVVGLGLLHRKVKQLAWELLPWVVLALPIVIITRMAQPAARHEFVPTVWQRLLISGDSLSFYLLKLLAPLNLGPDYGRTPQFALQQDLIYLTGLLPYLVAALIIWRAGAAYRAAAGIFGCALLPVLGISTFTFQLISTVADRYLYLAMLGPALAVSWFLSNVQRRLVWGIALAVLALLGLKSATQVPIWRDSIAFGQQAIAVNPRSWTAYGNLGNAKADQNQQEEAIGFYQQALALKPDDEKTTFNLGVSYGLLNQTEEAIAAFRRTIELVKSDNHKDKDYKVAALRDAYVNLGLVYDKSRRLDEAIASYQQAIAIDPGSVSSHASLGDLYAETGQTARAVTAYQKALALDPAIKGVNGNLGLLLAAQGDLAAAVSHFNKALAQTPGDLPLRLNLGLALYHQQDLAGASRQLLQVAQAERTPVELAAEAYNGLAGVYMAQGRWQEARDALRKVLRYAPDHQLAKDNLQRVMAEMGTAR